MHTFEIEIKETLSRAIEIKANSKDEAIDIAEKMYNDSSETLDSGDLVDTEFNVLNDLCPTCDIPLVNKMFDVDGTNLEEHAICPDCEYGTPAVR